MEFSLPLKQPSHSELLIPSPFIETVAAKDNRSWLGIREALFEHNTLVQDASAPLINLLRFLFDRNKVDLDNPSMVVAFLWLDSEAAKNHRWQIERVD